MKSEFRTLPPPSCTPETNFLPFVSELVLQSRQTGRSHFLSVTIESNYSDPLAILEAIYDRNDQICYMEKPAAEFSIAAGGCLKSESFSGMNRFLNSRLWAENLFENTIVAGDHKIAGTGPTLFTSATFEAENESSIDPPPLHIFLPRWQVVRHGGSNFLISNTKITPKSCPNSIIKEFHNNIKRICGMRFDSESAMDPHSISVGHPTENYDYELAVEKALKEINEEKLSKVVLARQLSFDTSSTLPPFTIAHALRQKFPECHTFCISNPDHGLMVGASPETLLRTSGNTFETEALAGSAPRGLSAGKDAHLGKTLLGREKEIIEHRLVIQSILRRLASIGMKNCHEGKARLLRLANLQHAKTPVSGKLDNGIHPFDVLTALHPTPAMGGSPREVALPLVRNLEKKPRGWYSGVTGWLDNRGRGEFIVPIRCGKITPEKLTLYAGAGLVEGSIPKQEKLETDWKLQAMLEVITGRTSLPES